MANPVVELYSLGQSLWYDNISRELLDNGELSRLITQGCIRGLTSNPAIFEKALCSSSVYDTALAQRSSDSVKEVLEDLMIEDIGRAADLLLPIFEQSAGLDGYACIEVSPLLARNPFGTIEEAKRLFRRLGRPNIMVKVPGTSECLGAISHLLEEGININITLLFSVANYEQVAKAYLSALSRRAAKGLDIAHIASVASFFVSRVDTAVDARLEAISLKQASSDRAETLLALRGRCAIANCALAYETFLNYFHSPRFMDLQQLGAKVQRPLWASTSTKNSAYRELIYVEELVARETVNTVPHPTLLTFIERGEVKDNLVRHMRTAKQVFADLASSEVDVAQIQNELQEDGVKKFTDAFASLQNTVKSKMSSMRVV